MLGPAFPDQFPPATAPAAAPALEHDPSVFHTIGTTAQTHAQGVGPRIHCPGGHVRRKAAIFFQSLDEPRAHGLWRHAAVCQDDFNLERNALFQSAHQRRYPRGDAPRNDLSTTLRSDRDPGAGSSPFFCTSSFSFSRGISAVMLLIADLLLTFHAECGA